MRIVDDIKLDFSDVLIVPKRSTMGSRKDVQLERSYMFRNAKNDFGNEAYNGIPIMAANMDGVGTLEMATALSEKGMFTCLVKHYPAAKILEYAYSQPDRFFKYTALSIGVNSEDYINLGKILKTGGVTGSKFKYICIDVANGYSEFFLDFCSKVRQDYPDKILIAGNVVTPEITEELILKGIDIVKIGIGPGSVCTTRKQTGVGYPQLSAIIECADAAHGLGGHIIADGGCTCPGDIVKAFGAGADFVMLGGMFAGHPEGGGEVVEINNINYRKFYGMSSETAMNKHSGGMAEYRSSEGKEVLVENKPSLDATCQSILGGLRSGMTYVGAKKLKELSKRTTFIRVNNQLNNVYGK